MKTELINENLLSINVSALADVIKVSVKESMREVISELNSEKDKRTDSERNLLSRKEVMETFNLSPVTLWKLERDGKLQGQRLGRKVFYRYDDILKSMESKGGRYEYNK
mgnify:CR=1 FL=1